jgi:type II secretory pathway component GspD/PulD (secretin)
MRRRPGQPALWLAACLALPSAAAALETIPAPSVDAIPFQEKLQQPITADFEEVDFASAVQFLSENGGVNIILSEQAKIQGRPVTVHLLGMPLQRALEHILRGQGLLFRYDRDTIWVATREEIESEPMETRVIFLNSGPGLFAAFEPMAATRESVALQATSVRELKTIKDILTAVIPELEGSSMMLDERSGALIVTHAPYYLQQIDALLVQLDVTPVQVLIEARFIEVTFRDVSEWGFDAQLTGNAPLTKKFDGQTEGSGLQLSSLGTSLLRGTKVDFTDFANQASGNGLNLTFQGVLTGTQYQAILHALSENRRTKTLSAPRVTTLNNETATIKIVTEFVYATRYEASVVREDLNGNGSFGDVVNGTRETRFVNVPQDFVTKDLGILLHVTPSVGKDLKTITLALKPEVSEKKTDDAFGGEVVLPRFTSRNLETSVVIENGQTVVLGGLMKDTTGRTVTKVPVLGSMPLVGKLFRKEDDTAERSNLLIFVTAQLVQSSGALAQTTEPPADL